MASENRQDPTEQEVDQEIRRLLTQLTTPPFTGNVRGDTVVWRYAVSKLWSQGYITEPFVTRYAETSNRRRPVGTRNFFLTPAGWEYWQQLRLGTVRYWVKNNWFPVAVAGITGLFSLGALIVGVLDLVLKS